MTIQVEHTQFISLVNKFIRMNIFLYFKLTTITTKKDH